MNTNRIDAFLSSPLLGRRPAFTIVRLIILVGGLYLFLHFLFAPVIVSGTSMHPAYQDGQLAFVNKLAYWRERPQRGDVVLVNTGEELLLKRVIALPGEEVAIENGIVLVNGKPFHEPYVKHRYIWNVLPRTLGPNEYLVIGDNRGMRQWQHTYGIATLSQIEGRAIF